MKTNTILETGKNLFFPKIVSVNHGSEGVRYLGLRNGLGNYTNTYKTIRYIKKL